MPRTPKLKEYLVTARITGHVEMVVMAEDKKDALARVEQGDGQPCEGMEWEVARAESAEEN